VLLAIDPHRFGMQVGRILAGIQVTPDLLLGVIIERCGRPTSRALPIPPWFFLSPNMIPS